MTALATRRTTIAVGTRPEPFSRERAVQLGAVNRMHYDGKWWTLAALQCKACVWVSGGDPKKMGIAHCHLVHALVDKRRRQRIVDGE